MFRGRVGTPIGVVVTLLASALIAAVGAGPRSPAASRLVISAGSESTCAKLPDGTARCWGNKKWGQLGNARRPVTSSPVTVQGLAHVVSISSGARHDLRAARRPERHVLGIRVRDAAVRIDSQTGARLLERARSFGRRFIRVRGASRRDRAMRRI